MNGSTKRKLRLQEVKQIFEECGFGNAELLEGWDGDELAELADLLTEEEFQTLLDKLAEPDGERVS